MSSSTKDAFSVERDAKTIPFEIFRKYIYIYIYIYIYEAKTVSEDLTKESKLKKEKISKKLDVQQI